MGDCTPYQRLSWFSITATGMRSVVPVMAKPGGALLTWSPWLIHTSSLCAPAWSVRPSNSQLVPTMSTWA